MEVSRQIAKSIDQLIHERAMAYRRALMIGGQKISLEEAEAEIVRALEKTGRMVGYRRKDEP